MSQNEESKCNQCLVDFNKYRNPIKMPGCPHNLCDSCLKAIKANKTQSIQCSFCNFDVTKVQSKKFETNRLLALKLKEKCQSAEHSEDTSNTVDNCEEQFQNEESQDLLLESEEINSDMNTVSQSHPSSKEDMCEEHEKCRQIICTTDLKMICAHCAIFGNHKDHCFKTIKQFNKDIEQCYEKLQIVKQEKYMYDKKIKISKEKEKIEAQINAKKSQIRKEVERKFKSLVESINAMEETICQEINKSYSNVYKEIMATLELQNKVESEFHKWQSESEDFLGAVQSCDLINEKIKIMYGGTLKLQQGQALIEKLNGRLELQNKRVEGLLGSVVVQFQNNIDFSDLVKVTQKLQQKKDTFIQAIENLRIPTGKHIVDDLGDESQNSFLCEYSSKHDFSLVVNGQENRPPTKSVMSKRSNYINDLSKFKSPIRKTGFESSHTLIRNKSGGELKVNYLIKNKSQVKFLNRSSAKMNDTVSVQAKDANSIVSDFVKHDLKQVLDLSRCELNDENLVQLLKEVRKNRKIRGLKLNHNEITDSGFEAMIEFIGSTSNLNLSHNKLTEESLSIIIKNRDKISPLRIVNFSSNGLPEKKCKSKIDTLRKMGIIVNI